MAKFMPTQDQINKTYRRVVEKLTGGLPSWAERKRAGAEGQGSAGKHYPAPGVITWEDTPEMYDETELVTRASARARALTHFFTGKAVQARPHVQAVH
ncbi:hypothetical protein ACU4HD_12670 [Cupriavidus basilensis]